MNRRISIAAMTAALVALPGAASALTRDLAGLEPARLSFERSVLNQLTHGTYRVPYDELQTRPYNLLFSNIGRHPNLTPWQGQEGSYRRYVNALIGNNGAVNVDNDADSIQGAWVQRQTARLAWGVSAAFFAGNDGSDDSSGLTTFSDVDDLSGVDVRGSVGYQLSERSVLGVGLRANQASSEITDSSFEQGVGGFFGSEQFEQMGLSFDVGLRRFLSQRSSWEVRGSLGLGSYEQDDFSENVDDTGAVTDRLVIRNYDIDELNLAIFAGYNRLKLEGIGETQYRIGLERSERELGNSDLSFSESAGGVTPSVTLLGQDPVTTTRITLSARKVFQAGHTEMFTGAELGYSMVEGSSQVEAQGVILSETVDDSAVLLGLILGLRQPLYHDKLRFIVSGRADAASQETRTVFDAGEDGDDRTETRAQYAIGLEGVLANVTFDLAWISGEEAAVVPVPLGVPGGSRRVIEVDRLVVSAAVSW